MTPERIEQLRKRYERWSFGGVRDAVIVECLDEIERLKALAVTQSDLSVCYRVGRRPSERLLNTLEKLQSKGPSDDD